MDALAIIAAMVGFVITIFWLVIGWRAMTAHERIADALTEWKYQQRAEREEKRRLTQPDPPQYKGWRPPAQGD